MSGDRFEVPENVRIAGWGLGNSTVQERDVVALCRAEVERALQWMAPHLHTHWAGYCAARFGSPSSSPEPAIISSSRFNCTCPRPSDKYAGDCPVHPKADSQLCGACDRGIPACREGNCLKCTHPKDHTGPHSWAAFRHGGDPIPSVPKSCLCPEPGKVIVCDDPRTFVPPPCPMHPPAAPVAPFTPDERAFLRALAEQQSVYGRPSSADECRAVERAVVDAARKVVKGA